jgi:pilus assembly protein CpaC
VGFSGLSSNLGGNGFNGLESPPPGLVAQLARGLVLTSESGRVVSLLTVDDLAQVQVAIRVLEIDRSRARSLGVDYRIDARHFSVGNLLRPTGEALPDLRGQAASVSGAAGNLMGAYVDNALAMVAAIDALEHVQIARSVAEPNILTLSGEEASVLVGGEIPIPTTTVGQITTVQSFAFREFGVRLDIRPTVGENDVIALEVSPSIVRPTPGLTAGGVPGFQVQSVETTARVQAGQSLVIGGLLTLEEGKEERKIPLLGDVPLLKEVFRWHRKTRRERELLFVITPRLVSVSGPDAPIELPETSGPPRFGDPSTVDYSLEERRKYDPRNYQLKDQGRK